MEITTIACPPGFTDPNVDENAPIWVDDDGNEYRVASGQLDGYTATSNTLASPLGVTVAIGPDGKLALENMGLKVKDV